MKIKDGGKKVELNYGPEKIPMVLTIAPSKKYRAVLLDSPLDGPCRYDWSDTPEAALECMAKCFELSVSHVPPFQIWIEECYPVEINADV